MVNTAESDIVSPSVTTEDPLGFLSQEVFILNDVFAYIAVNASSRCSYQLIGSSTVGCADSDRYPAIPGMLLLHPRKLLPLATMSSTFVFRPSRIAF